MSKLPYDPDKIQVKLATAPEDIETAQAIRYQVFYEEYGATPNAEMLREKRDIDAYDSVTDHLIVVDNDLPEGKRIVGTYRVLRRDAAEKHGQFYTSNEYNIQPLLDYDQNLLELGRSCVLPEYRTRPVLNKLWEGIAHYVSDHNISLMFGCASFHGTEIESLKEQLSYLYHYHLAPPELRARTKDEYFVDMNMIPKEDLDAKAAFISMPPLLKGYIRLGAYIGDGAYIDDQFNTTDVCIIMPTSLVRDKYVKHYERKTQKAIPVGEKVIEAS